MSKLSRYNNVLLAILGTAAVIAAIVGLIAFLVIIIDDYNRDRQRRDDGVTIEKPDDGAIVRRTQEVTYSSPELLDSNIRDFIIPVSQVNLATAEEIERAKNNELLNSTSSYSYYSRSGINNNFIYMQPDSGTMTKIFTDKAAIGRWSYIDLDNLRVIAFLGTKTDFNKDGRLNNSDYQSLFIYYLADKTLKEYRFEEATVNSFYVMYNSQNLILNVGIDKDGDGTYESDEEAVQLHQINLESREANLLVPEDLNAELQALVDGTVN